MTYFITKDFDFAASHQLRGLPASHKCSRLHGHNYLVRITLAAEQLDPVGFVVDYGALASFKALLDNRLDHRHLNDVLQANPTAEVLAAWLFGQAADLGFPVVEVAVSETPKTWAWYRLGRTRGAG